MEQDKLQQNILEEMSSNELLDALWEINKHCYKERPVTISEFVESPKFLGDVYKGKIFPLWKDTLERIYPNPFTSPYTEVIISAATGSGKSTVATIGMLYDMYKLGCLKNPAEYYGLAKDTTCVFAFFSTNLALAASVNWGDMVKCIKNSSWFMERLVDKRGLDKKNGSLTFVEVLPKIAVQIGSRFQHSMGKAIFGALMDEAAFGTDKSGQAQKTYIELFSRMATRFISYSDTGELPGHMWLCSSPKDAADFLQTRIDAAEEAGSKNTLILENIASWQANPNNDSPNKFTVFIGNEFKEAKIIENNEDVDPDDMDFYIYPPMRFYEFFKKDLLSSIMNYGGIRSISDIGLFGSPSLVRDAMATKNPFKTTTGAIKLPFKDDIQLMDFMDESYFRAIRAPEANRFIHMDAAFSSKTLDRFGLAAVYCTLLNKEVYTHLNEAQAWNSNVFVQGERLYYVDWAIGIEPVENQEIPFKKIENFILYLAKVLKYPIAGISADTFQSKRTLQEFEAQGYHTVSISVDRSRDPYLFFKDLVTDRQIVMPHNEILRKEMIKLRDDGKKVDHPIGGCFTEDTRIALVDGRHVSIKDLMLEQQYKQNWVYTINEKTLKIEPKPIKKVFQTKIVKKLVRVELDNGEIIECTPEHRFMLRDGSYEEIQYLKPGISLMPLYTKLSQKGLSGYRLYYEPMEDQWHYEHRTFGNPTKEKNIVHHCNYNKLDNTPTNLLAVTKGEHTRIHNNQTKDYEKIRLKAVNWHINNCGTEKYKERSRKLKEKRALQTARDFAKLSFEEQQQKLEKIKANQKRIQWIETRYNVKFDELTVTQKNKYSSKYYWQTTDRRQKQIERLKEEYKQNPKRYNGVKAMHGRIWITDGINNQYIKKEEQIPEGYKLGRTVSWKNHKIKSITFIEKPCKVYDLEIIDNHNFALAAGVFVHNSKDIADAVCGAIWQCKQSSNIINMSRVTRELFGPKEMSVQAYGLRPDASPEEVFAVENALREKEYSLYSENSAPSFLKNL